MANPSVREQMHELNTPPTPPVEIHAPPVDMDTNPRWSFGLGFVSIKSREAAAGSYQVPTDEHVLTHLPRYKALVGV